MDDAMPEPLSVNRRGLLLGAGAGVAAAATVGLVGAPPAGAAPTPGSANGAARPDDSPITTSIASAPISGRTYRSVCMYDFEPFNPAADKTWGGYGIYSATQTTAMRASIEIPPGALLRDVEFYVFNSSGSSMSASAWLFVPGLGTITSLISASIPSTDAISTTRVALSSAVWGPYPSGSRLLVGMTTPTDGTVQINGARVAFTQGAGEVGLLTTPQRAYDSRTTTKFGVNETRTITLSATAVPVGTTGVFLNVHVVDGVAAALVNVWSANQPEPTTSSVNVVSGATIANGVLVAVSSARQLKIRSSKAAHVVVDLIGTVG